MRDDDGACCDDDDDDDDDTAGSCAVIPGCITRRVVRVAWRLAIAGCCGEGLRIIYITKTKIKV